MEFLRNFKAFWDFHWIAKVIILFCFFFIIVDIIFIINAEHWAEIVVFSGGIASLISIILFGMTGVYVFNNFKNKGD